MERLPIHKCANLACGKPLSHSGFEQVRLQPKSGKQPPVVLILCGTCASSMQEFVLDAEHGLSQK